MARSRTTPVTTTVTVDAVDLLVSALNTLEGIAWTRDAWVNKAPDNYGVVENDGAPVTYWADNRMLAQVFQVKVHAYVKGSRDDLAALVQAKLAENCDSYTLSVQEYLYDIDRNHFTWNCQIIGPLQWDEVVTDGEV